jgi:glyoxylase-like metal-dependent hydrolase (beta-lactamase superfamily II)
MELKPLAPDVYACLQQDRGLGTSNSGFINRGGGLVVDTFWDLPHTRRMMDLYASVWRAPARRVVNTHHNGDHCWGNQLFEEAEIIGHRLCAASFGKEQPAAMQAIHSFSGSSDPVLAALAEAFGGWDFSGIELRPPTTLFEDQLDLELDDLHVELIYVGPAHTAGDAIVHIPEHRIVFAGDVLFRLCTPIGWEGTYAKWLEALDRIAALQPEHIVPGHGPVCGVEGLRELAEYLRYVRAESERHFQAERSALEAAKRIELGPYAGWTQPERLIFNVERAYRELRGEPFDTAIDVNRMFRDMFELRAVQASAQGR